MTPNMRQRKSRCANDIVDAVKDLQLSENDTIDVICLSLKKLGIFDKIHSFCRKPTKVGRKLTPISTRSLVWNFWHKNSLQSTITSRPASLRVTDKSKIQGELEFADTTVIVMKRKCQFYQSHWFITNHTHKELFINHLNENKDSPVSLGTFLALKPFYVRPPSDKDKGMCCCKKHLHARWSLAVLLKLCEKQEIEIWFSDYESFFKHLHADCPTDSLTYISWECTPTSKHQCDHVKNRWKDLVTKLHVKNKGVKTLFQHFENIEITLKNGKVVKRLKAVNDNVDLLYITNFITKFLYKFIHHRNQLKHYHATSNVMRDLFEGYIDINFLENLTVPVKFEPQFLHWSHEEITVHSGIIKMNGKKSYHPYLSMDRKHDHSCVEVVLNQMLCTIEVPSTIMIESDNCSSQYKCASHFHAIREISSHYQTKIIHVYGIAEHGKGELDHVGGLAKSAIRREITIGGFFSDAEDNFCHPNLRLLSHQNT